MAIYVDSEAIRWRGRQWCHMVADTLEELHVFAGRLGLERRWFQGSCRYPHYDVTMAVRSRALRMGAIDADRATLITCCKQVRSQVLSQHSENIFP
ncbi:DUF4031 domain-containing protein [Xanthomonas sp. MUS 060]|uniref:DUF4031 domain-containing protein n=1 Tax=Xanthomonas sp. MUS 060 TaxID=1588031 RepID=UPI0005F2D166|nr:DUF4031 domain-containing protein [Xanthomonas sp. MUS 060]